MTISKEKLFTLLALASLAFNAYFIYTFAIVTVFQRGLSQGRIEGKDEAVNAIAQAAMAGPVLIKTGSGEITLVIQDNKK